MARTLILRRWAFVHKWSSLVCTAFLLVICISGLPLVFQDEIEDLLGDGVPAQVSQPPGVAAPSLDRMIEVARGLHPGSVVWFVFVDDDEPQVVVGMLPSVDAATNLARQIRFDARTGKVLKDTGPLGERLPGFLELMLKLHRDLFLGLPGELFMGGMGLLFVTAVISGVVLYGPFTKKLAFGTVRTGRAQRIRWLDLHNLLGVVTLAWALVVGATGVMNELATPLFQLWQRTDVAETLRPYRGQPAPDALSSAQAAFDLAKQALPGRTPTSIVFPNDRVGSPHHYLVWTKGSTPLTSRLFSPLLVDARTGALTTVLEMPWYLRALEVSRPLHFGDYGGLPLKIIWALLDLVTIAVLGSGLYLWLARRKTSEPEFGLLGDGQLDA